MNSLARFAYNSQIGGSVWGGGITVSGTLFGQMSPGPVSYVPNDFERGKGEKVYEHKNHLGNVLLVTTDLKLGQEVGTADDTTDYYLPEVVAASDFYPFGMPMSGRTWQAGDYRYGFNGKESDDEWSGEGNSYDFGARMYDGRLGRWMSVDPLAIKYPFEAPYAFAGNSPVAYYDPNGMEVMIYGSKKSVEDFVALLNNLTGNKYGWVEKGDGYLLTMPTEDVSHSPLSVLIGMASGGEPDRNIEFYPVYEDKDTYFDNYFSGAIDLIDFLRAKDVPEFQSAIMAHIFAERLEADRNDQLIKGTGGYATAEARSGSLKQYNSVYNVSAHPAGLVWERKQLAFKLGIDESDLSLRSDEAKRYDIKLRGQIKFDHFYYGGEISFYVMFRTMGEEVEKNTTGQKRWPVQVGDVSREKPNSGKNKGQKKELRPKDHRPGN